MNLIAGLQKLLGGAGNAINQGVQGAENAAGQLLGSGQNRGLSLPGILPSQLHPGPHSLQVLLQQVKQLQPLPYAQQMPQQGQQQWNPSMGGAPIQNYMNTPYHAPIPSFMGNQYAQNPTAPQYVGPGAPDPMMFGYPADNTARPFNPYQ